MATAPGPDCRSDLLLRKPAVSALIVDTKPTPVSRQAFGADVVGSRLSPRAQLGYRVLVDHVNRGHDPRRPYDGQVFLTDETFAVELGGVSKRQVQRIRSELLLSGWVCLPRGDAGGRGNSTIFYHLHPDGRPCTMTAGTPLKQRAAAEQANQQRTATRAQKAASLGSKDDKMGILSGSKALKDDSAVILCPERMTESTIKDDKNDVKDDRTSIAYKEELFQELTPELTPPAMATTQLEEFPPDFARLMDEEIALDDGALRRLWQGARAILPDASAEEIRLSFRQRAPSVYRNRKLDNPTGLMLATIRDWFSRRRVLERRTALLEAGDTAAALEWRVANELAKLRLVSEDSCQQRS